LSGLGVIDQAVPLQSAEKGKYPVTELLLDFVVHFVQIDFISQRHQVVIAGT
jgi:hypothetical protein